MILTGDCIEQLREHVPDKSVHCCVTSPPYYGLRDYGVEGQIGLEDTPAEFVSRLADVFREVRRVLRDDGTLWVNLGDSYASGSGASTGFGGQSVPFKSEQENSRRCGGPEGYKPKDLLGIPWQVAFALREDGWYLRQDIIWHKPAPMPESVRDRCTKAHEYIFLLSKSKTYYYDADAIAEPAAGGRERFSGDKYSAKGLDGFRRNDHGRHDDEIADNRNRRSVWTVTTQPYSAAHFATFPPKLIEPCILAGCPEGGTVLDPFGGSGTTGMVAKQHRRKFILCELNPDYVKLAEKRTSGVQVEAF